MKSKSMFKRFLMIMLALALLAGSHVLAPRVQAETPVFSGDLLEGDEGEAVLMLQTRLKELGYYQGPLNGKFDADTVLALKAFQAHNNLLKSGILDVLTHQALYSSLTLTYEMHQFKQVRDAFSDHSMGTPGVYAFPSMAAERYSANEYKAFSDNRFLSVITSPLSTFAADVDTASYAQLRRKILSGEVVPPDSVRIEEMLNYFNYHYVLPNGDEPLGVTMELGRTPWNKDTWLLLIGLQAKEIPHQERPRQNLVFLIDVSGSMDSPVKLPLVKRSFQLLLEELHPEDTVSIVTYASRDEVVLDGIRAGEKTSILDRVDSLSAGGMTAGADGINTAYEIALKHFIPGGNNRILLATDGDLNLGVSDEGSLARLVEERKKSGIFLSVLGFGDGNYKDNKLEALADCGDGNYAYIDTIFEARRALVEEIGATFFTDAKDVKLQVDFNPAYIKGYRLLGYENRLLDAEDFADDTKDGGELGSSHRMTALYELVSVDSPFDFGETTSKYATGASSQPDSAEMLTLSIRAKEPAGEESKLYTYPLLKQQPGEMTDNLRFAAAVAQTGMLLRDSELKGAASYASTLALLRETKSISGDAYKEEFLYMITLLERAER